MTLINKLILGLSLGFVGYLGLLTNIDFYKSEEQYKDLTFKRVTIDTDIIIY